MLKELNTILGNLKNQFLELIPNILISLILLGIGYLVARLIKFLIIRLINHIGLIVSRTFKTIDLKQAGTFIGTAGFWLILFSTVLLITDVLGLTVLTTWFETIIQYIPNLIAALLIIFAAMIIGNLVSNFIISVSERLGLEYSTTLGRIARFSILFVAIIIAMDQIGIKISYLIDITEIILAFLLFGAALAFGLGARTPTSNILGSFYVRKSYREGDEIQIGKIKGKIIKIDATCVILEAEMGQVSIPAKEFNETKSFLITKTET